MKLKKLCSQKLRQTERQPTAADAQLFDSIQTNYFHILHNLLLPDSTASQNYSLRPRVQNLQLPDHPNHLDDSNFIMRF